MLEQQRQAVDVKPLPPPPPKTFEEKVGDQYPSQTTPDQKETSGLFKKLASKLKSPTAVQSNTTQTSPKRSLTVRARNAPPLTNDFSSKETRDAALRERGLMAAPNRDLSQLEKDRDRKYTKVAPVPRDQATKDGQQTAAEKIRQEWKAKNQAGRV